MHPDRRAIYMLPFHDGQAFISLLQHDCPLSSIHIDRHIDALHLNAQSGVIAGDSRFTRLPNGNHPRKARPAFNV
jgi:hypothetical protein